MRVVWTPRAAARLSQIGDVIAEENPLAAVRMTEKIVRRAGELARFPRRGRVGRVSGTRELVIARTRYVVIYRIDPRAIEIVGVLHGAQRWPRRF